MVIRSLTVFHLHVCIYVCERETDSGKRSSSFAIYLFSLFCVYERFACMCVRVLIVCSVLELEEASDTLKLGLWMVVHCHMSVGNRTWVFWESNQCCESLSHCPSPTRFILRSPLMKVPFYVEDSWRVRCIMEKDRDQRALKCQTSKCKIIWTRTPSSYLLPGDALGRERDKSQSPVLTWPVCKIKSCYN